MTWRDFWSGQQASAVDSRQRALYFADIGKEIAALVPSPEAVVLDYGCGDAPAADLVAEKCARLYLYGPAPRMEAVLRRRYAGVKKIVVLDDATLPQIPDTSLDLMICNSTFQHLSREECAAVVAFAERKVRLGGRLIVADILPPHVDALTDSWSMVEFAYRGGFLLAALRGFVRTTLAKYRTPRRALGLTTFAIPEMQRLLSTHGFEARRSERNIGHNQARMTFLGKRV